MAIRKARRKARVGELSRPLLTKGDRKRKLERFLRKHKVQPVRPERKLPKFGPR